MLKRKLEEELKVWKNKDNKKCLIIEGARQVGKTFTIRRFAEQYYDNYIELNFINKPSYCKIFDGDLDVETILMNISLYCGFEKKIQQDRTLIFLDEIQACPNAITALKFFSIDGSFDVIASGSLLGISYSKVASYPTGYVQHLQMYPLTFEEFLWANGVSDEIILKLQQCYENIEEVNAAMNVKIQDLFKQYMVVGGMPEVVNSFVTEHNYATVLKIQRAIVKDYENDIAKYAESGEKVKAKACFKSIPVQLSRTNKKFMYSIVEKNSKSSKYIDSVNWLIDAGIVARCNNLARLELPLMGYVQENNFKIYMSDTGLLVSMLDDETNAQIIEGNLGIYSGAVFENVVAQILRAHSRQLYFFNRNNSLEIDFVISQERKVIPIEVKAGNNKAKSLRVLLDENPTMQGIKLVNGNVGYRDRATTYPHYMSMFL